MEQLLKVLNAKLQPDVLAAMCKEFGRLLQGDRYLNTVHSI